MPIDNGRGGRYDRNNRQHNAQKQSSKDVAAKRHTKSERHLTKEKRDTSARSLGLNLFQSKIQSIWAKHRRRGSKKEVDLVWKFETVKMALRGE